MKIKRLTLTNFQGVRSFTMDTDGGKNVSIFADNATGKTTIYNAFLWLLFEKNSLGAKDFDIKTRDENGQVIPAINHEVEAVLEIDGREVTLKRVYLEKYTKKRGSSIQEFTGHVTEHFINGAPKSKGEYQGYIDSIAPEKLFMCLTSPTFFNEQLSWQDRRKMLLGLCPEINDADILADQQYADLRPILEKHSVEDAKKVEMATRKKINDELTGIPGRIDEATRAIPEGATGNLEALAAKAQKIAKEIEPLRNEKATIISGGQIAEKQKALAEVEHDILSLNNRHLLAAGASCEGERKQAHDLANKLQIMELQIDVDKGTVSRLQTKIENHMAESRKIAAQWVEQNNRQFVTGGVCPTCGQDYPENLLAVQESDFNRAKSVAMEAIVSEGKANETAWKECKAALEVLTVKIARDEQTSESLRAEIEALRNLIASKSQPPAVEELPEYLELDKSRADLAAEVEKLKDGSQSAEAEIDAKISAKQDELDDINRKITAIETADIQRRRIDELKAREKELAAQFEASEKILFLIEQFIQAKVGMLEESINGKFELVRWKLFDQQVNGGISETCVCTMGGVPYPSINNGAKIQGGLDIIKSFSWHYGIDTTVWVDNAESVTLLPEMPCQVVRMVVSEEDKKLRVEACC